MFRCLHFQMKFTSRKIRQNFHSVAVLDIENHTFKICGNINGSFYKRSISSPRGGRGCLASIQTSDLKIVPLAHQLLFL